MKENNMKDSSKKANTLTQSKAIAYDNLSATARHLEKMAKEGWMLKEVLGMGKLTFEKCEPKTLRFSVEIFAEGSVFDTTPTNENLEYIEYCKRAGWNFICANGNLNFFYTEDKNAPEIETDQEMKLNIIRKAMRPNNVITPLIMLLMGGFFLYNSLVIQLNLTEASVLQFSSLSLWTVAVALNLVKLIHHFLWIAKAKGAVKNGNKIPENKHFANFWTGFLLLAAIGIIYSALSVWAGITYHEPFVYLIPITWFIILSLVLVYRKFSLYLEKKKIQRGSYRAISMLVVPLCICYITMMIIVVYIILLNKNNDKLPVMDPADKLVFDTTGELEESITSWGHFMLNYDTYNLSHEHHTPNDASTDNDKLTDLHINIFSTENQQIYDRIMKEGKEGVFRLYGLTFPFEDATCATDPENAGVTVWSAYSNDAYRYLICDGTYILDTRCNTSLDQEKIAILEKTFMSGK